LTWGNHEHDLPHEYVLAREKEFRGTWINSNMQDHESVHNSTCQVDSAMISVDSADGTNTRNTGLVAVLTNEASLYAPGAFGGATITDPWTTLAEYKHRLESNGADVVVPLCHLYEWQDAKTAALFDFPVILSGHDHHSVDRTMNGSRLLKPGQDAVLATMVDLSWADGNPNTLVNVAARHLTVADWTPDATLKLVAREAYAALKSLRSTQLAVVPDVFRPFTSGYPRERRNTVATYMCTLIRNALSTLGPGADLALIQGGFFKASLNYPDSMHFTLEVLRGELMSRQGVVICQLPGSVLRVALRESWTRPSPGWIQMDGGVEVDAEGFVVAIYGEPLVLDRL
jgi:2',3'-cyclic-nucleotide 2'-phosphodiesterase (5'-nucleotidase family)